MKKFKLEICLDSVESAIEAEKGGADRVELCDNLFEGGTTPSYGEIKLTREKINIGLQVIIRPRGGDFCYTDIEFEVMKQDIQLCKELGVDGVVIGILLPDGSIDVTRSKELVNLARPMNVTFHRAFDMANDYKKALEDVIETGANRLLTSGQESSAIEGMFLIKELLTIAKDKIIIMPGAGITNSNIDFFLKETNAKEIHLAVQKSSKSKMKFQPNHIFMGGYLHLPEFSIFRSDATEINKIRNKG